MSGRPVCPQCATPVELHWEWCHACGFDPEGKRPPEPATSSSALLQGGDTTAAAATPSWDAPAPGGFSLLDAPPASSFDAPSPSSFDLPPASTFDAPAASSFDAPPPISFESAPPPPTAPAAPVPAGPSFDTDSLNSGAAFNAPPPPPPGLKRPETDTAALDRIPGANAFRRKVPLEGNLLKVLFGVLAGVAVMAMLFVGASKIASSERVVPTTTTNPAAPPIGAIELTPKGVPTTAAPTDGWVIYKSPDGTFSAQFPKTPTPRGSYVGVGGRDMPTLLAFAEVGDNGGFAVETLDLPTAAAIADGQQLLEGMNSSGYGATIVGSMDVGGVAGATYTKANEAGSERGVVIVKGARAYFLYAVNQPDAEVDRFLKSFRITGDVAGN